MVSCGKVIFLHTVKASISPSDNLNNLQTVRILLDGGCQHSYATAELQQLNICPVRKDLLAINAFGGDSNTSQVRDVSQPQHFLH